MIRFYRGDRDIEIYRWAFRVRWRWIRGLGLGVEVYPWRERMRGDNFWTFANVEFKVLVVAITIEHTTTRVKPLTWRGREEKP